MISDRNKSVVTRQIDFEIEEESEAILDLKGCDFTSDELLSLDSLHDVKVQNGHLSITSKFTEKKNFGKLCVKKTQ